MALAFHAPRVPPSSFPIYVQAGIPDLTYFDIVLVSWRHLSWSETPALVNVDLMVGKYSSFRSADNSACNYSPRVGIATLYCSRCVRFSRDASHVSPACDSYLNRSLRHVGVPVLSPLELMSDFLKHILGDLARMDLS